MSAISILNEPIDDKSDNIDYLETSIKCVELYQWLSRHFNQKNFYFDEKNLLENKAKAIERLNELLSDKIGKTCSSCGCKMPANARFNICDECFSKRRFNRRPPRENSSAGEREKSRSGGKRRGGRGHYGPSEDSGSSGKSREAGMSQPRPSGLRYKGPGKKSDAAKAFKKFR